MTDNELDAILAQALQPRVDLQDCAVPYRKGQIMKYRKFIKCAAIVAVVVILLTTTAFATGLVEIKSLVSGTTYRTAEAFSQLDKLMRVADFQIDAVEHFDNGYSFARANVQEVKALGSDDQVQYRYNELSLIYENPEGCRIYMRAMRTLDDLTEDTYTVQKSHPFGDVTVNYYETHYKFVPEDYELTEEDRARLETPDFEISYGSDSVVEQTITSACWEKNGVSYLLMDMFGRETSDSLFCMAQNLIENR